MEARTVRCPGRSDAAVKLSADWAQLDTVMYHDCETAHAAPRLHVLDSVGGRASAVLTIPSGSPGARTSRAISTSAPSHPVPRPDGEADRQQGPHDAHERGPFDGGEHGDRQRGEPRAHGERDVGHPPIVAGGERDRNVLAEGASGAPFA